MSIARSPSPFRPCASYAEKPPEPKKSLCPRAISISSMTILLCPAPAKTRATAANVVYRNAADLEYISHKGNCAGQRIQGDVDDHTKDGAFRDAALHGTRDED